MYKCILLVDDDPIQNLINAKLITKIKITKNLRVATNGEEAFEKHLSAMDNMPEVIFLDINMPIMDGWQFLDVLSMELNHFKPRIFMLSSPMNSKDISRSNEHGLVERFITKPLTLDKIKFLKAPFVSRY